MILGVLSDTHSNRVLMHQVAAVMVEELGAEVLFHLGDDYSDAEDLAMAGYSVRKVPGLWCPEYQNPSIPKRIVEEFDGITVAAAHAEKDLRHAQHAAGIILLGHTHRPRIEHIGLSLYVNPGHLRSTTSRGVQPASFAIVEIGPTEVRAAIHDPSGALRREVIISRDRLA